LLRLDKAPLIDLIVASYDTTEQEEPWAVRVVTALKAVASSSIGGAYHFTSGYDGGLFQVRSVVLDVAMGEGGATSVALATTMNAPGEFMEPILGRTQGTTCATATRLGADLARSPGWRETWPAHVVDSLGFVARDANGDGFCACVGLDDLGALSAKETRVLAKLATHIGAGDRLRRATRANLLDDAEAILSPTGKVLHATETAKNKRDSLDDGRRRREEAKKNEHDTEKALEIWEGLIAGRWSLVDHFDTDGKRFLLAMKNAPQVDKRADLTPRERRVCALAAMGHRDKEIAYMLGLSLGSVTAALHRTRGKLGVGSRSELARVWRYGFKVPPR
jgi:DNA-binding CsgD family transcriptional regulator